MRFDKPFPHVITTDSFKNLRGRVLESWPTDDDPEWQQYENSKRAHRGVIDDVLIAGEILADVLSDQLGIPDLIFDETLRGAGMHETLRGGSLGMHVDFNQHPNGLYRRVNAILFLNEGWEPGDGGALWLQGKGPKDGNTIRPELGTLVVWETADDRWHGHPVPLQRDSRKSLAWYFYTDEKPPGFTKPHGTIYRDA